MKKPFKMNLFQTNPYKFKKILNYYFFYDGDQIFVIHFKKNKRNFYRMKIKFLTWKFIYKFSFDYKRKFKQKDNIKRILDTYLNCIFNFIDKNDRKIIGFDYYIEDNSVYNRIKKFFSSIIPSYLINNGYQYNYCNLYEEEGIFVIYKDENYKKVKEKIYKIYGYPDFIRKKIW